MKHTIQRLTLGLAALLPVIAPLAATAAPLHTGIRGQASVTISYGTPVEIAPGVWAGPPSVQLPAVTALTVLSARTGHRVGRVTTDANGTYALALHPGKYVLVPDTLTLAIGCSVETEPLEIAVRPRQVTQANVFYFRNGPCTVVVDESP